MKKIFQKLLSLLRVRSKAAGLEVSDRVLRLVHFDGKVWRMYAIRLEAGVMENGKIMNRPALIEALAALKAKMGKTSKTKKTNVSVCLSSVVMYTQVFALPVVEGESFDKAVELNLQMASPLEAAESHSGWQIVGKDENTLKTEVLSAFVGRAVVDEMADALFEAGFLAVSMESRALALTRVLREKGAGVDPAKPYLFVSIDNAGMDFLVIRKGFLFFEYTMPWHDLMDEKGEIAIPKFEASLAASLRQVTNFYNQHWTEPISAVILSAVALEEQAEKAVAANSAFPVVRLTLVMGQPISSEWLVALGCSLRTSVGGKGQEINLLGEDSKDRFHEEQLLNFMRFWRVLIPITLAILVITFFVADQFLINTRQAIESRSDFNLAGSQTTEITTLEDQAQTFNQQVALLKTTEAMQDPKNIVLAAVLNLATASNVMVNNLSFQSFTTPINLSGSATSETAVEAFKAALQSDARFSAVNLPLTGVQTQGNTVTFSMTFIFTP